MHARGVAHCGHSEIRRAAHSGTQSPATPTEWRLRRTLESTRAGGPGSACSRAAVRTRARCFRATAGPRHRPAQRAREHAFIPSCRPTAVLCQNSDQVQLGVTADSEFASSCVDFFFLFFLFRSRASKQRRSQGDGARPLPAASRPRDTLCRLQRRLLRVAPWTARRSRRCHCATGGITLLAGRTLPPGSNGSAPVAMRREGRGGGGEGGRCTARSPARTRTLLSRRAGGACAPADSAARGVLSAVAALAAARGQGQPNAG